MSNPIQTIGVMAFLAILCQKKLVRVELNTPRDRPGGFESPVGKEAQGAFTLLDDKILSRYASAMTTREIVATFKEIYDADYWPS
ncbi:putative transposase [Nitrosomonas aestuarii]|uniref:Putative transposase n=1 Tax=Nitrosomonas aestuarii TaxID=52441 RepID=A0A1I4F2Y5_9PROT|nr:transposase [Nitrosomonas aestuarii]SFL11126.1 putative transposase [Nitrosomonas aestuarii]